MTAIETTSKPLKLDVLVVGAGFGGIYALYKFRGLGMAVKAYEKGSGVGGTWFWNRYPGARCDVPSLEYSYSFDDALQQEWEWTEYQATQPEIERYANHVVDRYDLRKDIVFETMIETARFDESANLWRATASNGDRIEAKYLVLATGGYHQQVEPRLAGLEDFTGELFLSNKWPVDKPGDFAGKRIGLIGTGSSGVQTATALAAQPITHLTIFQRTAGYVVPAHNHRLDPNEVAEYKAHYPERRERARHSGYGVDTSSFPVGQGATMDLSDEEFEERAQKMWKAGGGTVQTAFPDFVVDAAANKRVADWINDKVRSAIPDPELAEKVCAKGHYLGAKRIIIIDGYTEALQQPNVSLVDVKEEPIVRITASGVETARKAYELDTLILATGFDSATGSILAVDIRGRDGARLADKWAKGHLTYLGLGAAGFPNMFIIAQVGSPGIRSHMMVSIEQHVDWLAGLFAFAASNGVETIEATPKAEQAWTAHLADVASRTLLTIDDTQHLGSNVPGKPRMVTSYLGGVGAYRKICDAVREHDYEGWVLSVPGGALPNDRDWSGPDRKIRWEDRDLEVGMEAGFL